MSRTLTLLSMIALCACAGANRAQQQRTTSAATYKAKDGTATSSAGQAAPRGKMICDEEVPLGSHIPVRSCRYESDIDEQRQQTQDAIRALQTPSQQKSGG